MYYNYSYLIIYILYFKLSNIFLFPNLLHLQKQVHAHTTHVFGHAPSFPNCVYLAFAEMLMAPIFDLVGFWKYLSLLCANNSRGRSVAVNNFYRHISEEDRDGVVTLTTSTSIT